MEKSLRYWFNLLPDNIKNKCIENFNNHYVNEINENFNIDSIKRATFSKAIYSSFIFSKTKEGFTYWSNISHEYRNLK